MILEAPGADVPVGHETPPKFNASVRRLTPPQELKIVIPPEDVPPPVFATPQITPTHLTKEGCAHFLQTPSKVVDPPAYVEPVVVSDSELKTPTIKKRQIFQRLV